MISALVPDQIQEFVIFERCWAYNQINMKLYENVAHI